MTTPLGSYMERHDIDDAAFAVLIGKDRSLVNRLRRGVVRPTLDVAGEIEVKTGGEVPMQAWVDGLASTDADTDGPQVSAA